MPELPDVAVYVECLERRLAGQTLRRVRIASPFVVRSFDPPIRAAEGRRVVGVRRLGKRIVFDLAAFTEAATRERHTLKRTLTDPRIFSGIGNAYSDEILHAAKLSPVRMCDALTAEEMARLYEATRATLVLWTDRLRREAGD